MRLLVGVFILAVSIFGIELEPGRTYSGPEKLTVSSLGASIGLPYHWNAIAKKGEGVLLFQDATKDTITIVSKSMNAAETISYLNEPHYLNNDLEIFPRDRIVKLNSYIYRRAYSASGDESRDANLLYIILGPQERRVVMKAQYDKAHENSIKATTTYIAQTLSFTPTLQYKDVLNDLVIRLEGAHFAYSEHEGGYDEKRELWLCSDRRYLLMEEHTVSGGMSRIQQQKLGKWSVEKSHLVLQDDEGLHKVIEITFHDKALFFDGHRSYELANHQCK